MSPLLSTVFWACILVVLYTYLGYPLLTWFLVQIKKIMQKKQAEPDSVTLPVTLIVAAYNEERIIRKKIENCFSLDYPAGLLHLLFVTDGSDDDTAAIVARYPQIRLLHAPLRAGKQAAVNRAMLEVSSPIVIFSDANTFLNREAVKNITRHYSDPRVGGVAGEKRISPGSSGAVSGGEGLYWRYESFLKKLDSDLKTTVGAAGELFSLRTGLYTPLPEDTIIEDFVQSLLLCSMGFVVRYDPDAYAQETASMTVSDEMERKVRIASGAFQAMGRLASIFNPFRNPALFFLFISHRILRWTLTPVALALLLVCSVLLALQTSSAFFILSSALQLFFYALAAAGWRSARKGVPHKTLHIPFYFTFMNVCVFLGFIRFVKNDQSPLWQRAERQGE